MTTIETLTLSQIHALGAEATQAGDAATSDDCELVGQRYIDSDCSDLAEFIDHERGEVRDAARRIVEVIRNAEARRETKCQ